MRPLLMIAFHYPPFQGSSGVLRTWNFSRYLPKFGWEPDMLTASVRSYESTGTGEGSLQVPASVKVTRAFALDAARHFALRGRYPRFLALPDRWLSWYPAAVMQAMRIIRRERPLAVWSTFPIATAHLVACSVQRLSGLPWIADFRDSMTEAEYPSDPRQRAVYRWIERRVVRRSAAVVFTTEGARRMYHERYSDVDPRKFHVLPNGFDEESFKAAELRVAVPSALKARPITLLHSGVLYPSERDPRPLLRALGDLKHAGRLSSSDLRIVLRASGHDALMREMISQCGVDDIVQLAPPISYGAALGEMLSVDALLLLQAANSNHQVPAKLYEYLRTGRPILALTDLAGDSAAVLRAAGVDTLADIASKSDIELKLPHFLELVRSQSAPVADRRYVERYSREGQAGVLAQLLDRVVSQR